MDHSLSVHFFALKCEAFIKFLKVSEQMALGLPCSTSFSTCKYLCRPSTVECKGYYVIDSVSKYQDSAQVFEQTSPCTMHTGRGRNISSKVINLIARKFNPIWTLSQGDKEPFQINRHHHSFRCGLTDYPLFCNTIKHTIACNSEMKTFKTLQQRSSFNT